MPYPDLYDVEYSYTGFQQAQGDNSFPGTQLDADLAGLEESIENVADFAKNVVRSDGALKNGVVTYDSLSADLQTAGFASATAWLTATEYFENVAVVFENSLYRCLEDHTSGVFATDLAADKWVFITDLVLGGTGLADGQDTGILFNDDGLLATSDILLTPTRVGYQYLGMGDNIIAGAGRITATKGPLLALNRVLDWSLINEATVCDYSEATAQDSISNQIASFASFINVTATAFNWNHIVGFEDLNVYNGSGTLTDYWSFYSAPTISGPTTSRKGFFAANKGGAGVVAAQYGFYCASLTGATVNWGFYGAGATPNYFGGNVLIGTAGVAPTQPLVVNKNVAAPLAPKFSSNIVQLTNVDGLGTSIELNAFGTGAVAGLTGRAARGTKASPSALQSGDALVSWVGTGYGATAFGHINGTIQLEALENFTDAAQGTAWAFYTITPGTVDVALRMRADAYGIRSSGAFASSSPVTITAASATMGAADSDVIFNTSATHTYTLLSAAAHPGRELHVKSIAAQTINSASPNIVPLAGGAAGTALLASGAGKWARLKSDGTNWVVMAGG